MSRTTAAQNVMKRRRNDAAEELSVIRVVVKPVLSGDDRVESMAEAIRDALIAREVRMARPVRVAVRAGGEDWRYYVHHRRAPRAVAALPEAATSAA